METKPRILYLQKILLERTDEENPLSTTQLINILNDEYGISAHRTTVTKDIAALQEFGMDIVTIHSTQSKYFVASRKFELPELKLLIDAVESSKFITKKKSETLIEKIHTMTSPGQVAKLKRNNYVVNRIKPDNEQIYYIIDAINDAINAGKKISFQYYDYTGLKKKVLKNKGEVYKLSPYKLLWCRDYYYVLGYSEKKSKVSGMIDVNHTLVYYDHRTEGSKSGCYFNVNTTKTPASMRQVPMLGFVREAFEQEKQKQEDLGLHCEVTIDGYTDFIFINRFGQAQHQATLNKAIRRIIRDCNDEQFLHSDEPDVLLPHFSCHSLRHTFTTRMCEAGVNIKVIQDALGHSDISTTLNIYADVTKEMKAAEFKGLDSYFKG